MGFRESLAKIFAKSLVTGSWFDHLLNIIRSASYFVCVLSGEIGTDDPLLTAFFMIFNIISPCFVWINMTERCAVGHKRLMEDSQHIQEYKIGTQTSKECLCLCDTITET